MFDETGRRLLMDDCRCGCVVDNGSFDVVVVFVRKEFTGPPRQKSTNEKEDALIALILIYF
jgi:hypothetical protein